jgi:hypothetical protein
MSDLHPLVTADPAFPFDKQSNDSHQSDSELRDVADSGILKITFV